MPLTTDLIAYWELEEASGTRADAHGSNDLTDVNTVTSATGKVGDSADFRTANSERLVIADGSLSAFPTTAATWAFWSKRLTMGFSHAFMSKWNHGVSSSFLFDLDNVGDGNLFFAASAGDTGSNRMLIPSGTFSGAGDWRFYVIQYDGSQATNAGKVRLWKDNVEVVLGSTGGIPSSLVDSSAELQMGGCSSLGRFYNGMLDQFGFWSRILTSGERDSLWNSGAGLSYAGLSSGGVTAPPFRALVVSP